MRCKSCKICTQKRRFYFPNQKEDFSILGQITFTASFIPIDGISLKKMNWIDPVDNFWNGILCRRSGLELLCIFLIPEWCWMDRELDSYLFSVLQMIHSQIQKLTARLRFPAREKKMRSLCHRLQSFYDHLWQTPEPTDSVTGQKLTRDGYPSSRL